MNFQSWQEDINEAFKTLSDIRRIGGDRRFSRHPRRRRIE
jgi:hypothetical protein